MLEKSPNEDTRTALLRAATRLFAEKGFYGASIAAIARELDLTKQALIHHFGSKERLYGEVLQQIADELVAAMVEATSDQADPMAQLELLLTRMYDTHKTRPEQSRLLMRELLDNRPRAERADTWYLKSFLKGLVVVVQRIPGWQSASEAEALAAVYQLLGAISYYAISEPTLTRIFGKATYAELDEAFPTRLRLLMRASFERPP
ncbi:MAG: TetR/AcrR family transcriptional regulator [Myxococcota bacterium]